MLKFYLLLLPVCIGIAVLGPTMNDSIERVLLLHAVLTLFIAIMVEFVVDVIKMRCISRRFRLRWAIFKQVLLIWPILVFIIGAITADVR